MSANAVTQFIGKYRRWLSFRSGESEVPIRLTHQESLAVAQVEPPGFEMARAGRRFILGNDAAITGIAPVQAHPTTAAQWAIWNADATKTMFFEELGVYLESGTPGVGGALLACLFRTPAQVGALVAGTAISRASKGSAASKAITKTSVTITDPAAPNWYTVAQYGGANVTAFASATVFEHRFLEGRIAVPPNYGLGLAVLAPAGTTPLFAPFAMWVEQETDME